MPEALSQERRRIHNRSGIAGDHDVRPPMNTTPFVCILEMVVALPTAEDVSLATAEQHSPILLMAARWGDQAPGFPPPRFLSSSIFQKKKAWAWVTWSACEMPVYEAAAGTKKLKEQARVFALHANALWCQHGVQPAVAPPRFGTPGTPSLRRGAFSCRLFSTTHSQVKWRRHLCHLRRP